MSNRDGRAAARRASRQETSGSGSLLQSMWCAVLQLSCLTRPKDNGGFADSSRERWRSEADEGEEDGSRGDGERAAVG
jgi:hypothetical protein